MATLTASGVICPGYMFDTHALYWHWTAPARLPTAVRDIIAAAGIGEAHIVVSHVVLAEMYFLFRKLDCAEHFAPRIAELQSSGAFQLEPLLLADIEQLPHFEAVPEMHDRLLVIQALRLNIPLVTKDASIHQSSAVTCIW